MNHQINVAPPVNTFVVPDARLLTLQAEIIDRVQKREFPSVSVGVSKDEHILWEESIGWVDKENNRAATPSSSYCLASLGKSITATALMLLVQEGKVDLNAPISQYLDGALLTVFEGMPDQVTLRRILNMTAAIPHGLMTFMNEADMLQYSLDDLLRNRGLVVFPPSEVYLYSNFSYILIEKVIENISGKSFPDFLLADVFEPLEMTSSFVGLREKIDFSGSAAQYDKEGSRLASRYALPRNSLAIYSSIDDLLRYARVHLKTSPLIGQFHLKGELLDQMHRSRGEALHSILGLGLGSLDLDNKHLWLLTNGRASGTQATLSMLPSEGLAVVCLINSSGQSADDLAFRISEAIVPGFLDSAMQIIREYEAWAEQPYAPIAELLGEWKGLISTASERIPIRLLFQPEGDVFVTVGDQLETKLTDIGYRYGLFDGQFIADLPMEEAAGQPHTITLSLRVKGTQLSGVITSNITNQKGIFLLGAYARLTRPE